jgi:hypothetical protein
VHLPGATASYTACVLHAVALLSRLGRGRRTFASDDPKEIAAEGDGLLGVHDLHTLGGDLIQGGWDFFAAYKLDVASGWNGATLSVQSRAALDVTSDHSLADFLCDLMAEWSRAVKGPPLALADTPAAAPPDQPGGAEMRTRVWAETKFPGWLETFHAEARDHAGRHRGRQPVSHGAAGAGLTGEGGKEEGLPSSFLAVARRGGREGEMPDEPNWQETPALVYLTLADAGGRAWALKKAAAALPLATRECLRRPLLPRRAWLRPRLSPRPRQGGLGRRPRPPSGVSARSC